MLRVTLCDLSIDSSGFFNKGYIEISPTSDLTSTEAQYRHDFLSIASLITRCLTYSQNCLWQVGMFVRWGLKGKIYT
jgi:hypothetical protein